jgi:hypothetical protein
VEHDGVRDEQDAHDDRQGDQPGGYLAAVDIGSGGRYRVELAAHTVTQVGGPPQHAAAAAPKPKPRPQ